MKFDDRPSLVSAGAGFVLWLLMLSATLVETDAYRYAAILVSFYGLYAFWQIQPRPASSLAGWLCLGWSVYVLARFADSYFGTANHEHGSSEWLYAFPMFFPGIGIGLVRMRFHIEKMLTAFFLLALGFLLATAHWFQIVAGQAVSPLIHNNQIHGSVASGMIMIGALYWYYHYAERGFRNSVHGRIALVAAPIIVVLCLIAIFGAKSKGVWLALAVTLPVAALVLLFSQRRLAGWLAVGAMLVLVGGLGVALRADLWAHAGPTIEATLDFFRDYRSGDQVATYLQARIASGTVPISMNERLEIWYNALQLFRQAPIFGHGNMWIELWDHTRYAQVGYTLMHNGYLEIVIRHGLFGLSVCALMLVLFLRMVGEARRAGIISGPAGQAYWMLLLFFMLTLLSNSNNRLSIGESFAMLSGGFAFYCQAMMRYRALAAPKTPAGTRHAPAEG